MNLYQVQDSERPMYVIAANWNHAIELWRSQIITENPNEDFTSEDPQGVSLIATHAGVAGKDSDLPDVIFPEDVIDCVQR